MSFVDFTVAGTALLLKDKYTPRVSTRKLYNATFFQDDQYRHEIANHYRDFKQRPSLKRRRRNVVARYRKPIYGERYGHVANRENLPVAVHNFPRFAAVYTARGRRTLCESQPPDETYNDAVRRIRAANSGKALAELVRRQLDLDDRKTRRTKGRTSPLRSGNKGRSVQSDCGKPVKLHDNNDSDSVKQSGSRKANQESNQRPRRLHDLSENLESLRGQEDIDIGDNENESSSSLLRNQRLGNHKRAARKPHHTNELSYYLQLATEYYEEGLLGQRQYLQLIGERNKEQQLRYDRDKACFDREIPHAEEAAATSSRESDTSASTTSNDCGTPRNQATPRCYRIQSILKSIGRKRSFRQLCQLRVQEDGSHDNPTIRVNITPAASCGEGAKAKARQRRNSKSNEAAHQRTCADSMNDYLNANLRHQNTNNNSLDFKVPAKQTHFHELIDNLRQLEIVDIDTALPKITLTDCSTTSNAFQATQTQEPGDKSQYKQRAANVFKLKETKFRFNTSLDIPCDTQYQSEARPP